MTLTVSVLLIIVTVLQLIISLLVLMGGEKPRPLYQKLFVWITTTLLVFMTSSVVLLFASTNITADNLDLFNAANSVAFFAGSLIILLIYFFSLNYPDTKKQTLRSRLTIGLGIVLTLLSPFKILSGEFTYNGKAAYAAGKLAPIIALYGITVVLSLFIMNIKSLRGKDEFLSRQVRTLLIGISLTIVHALIFILILPIIFGDNVTLYAIGYFAPMYFTGFVGYSLLKQNLFNVRLIVARSIAYVLSLGLITLSFSLLIFGFSGAVLESHFSQLIQRLFYVLVIVVLALTYQPVKRFFDKLTNRIFYRDAYDPQTLLDELNSGLVSTIELERLLEIAARIVTKHIKTQYCSFAIGRSHEQHRIFGRLRNELTAEETAHIIGALSRKPNKAVITTALGEGSIKLQELLSSNNIMAVTRLNTHAGTIGYMMLGDKKSGSTYTNQDARIIEIVGDELAIAIQNALRFEEIKQFNITLQQKVDEATKELREANAKLKELDQTKDEFISMASHQLRTPLTTIKGYLSMVLEGDAGPVKPKQKDMLEQSFQSASRMVYLIADLLNVSRLQSGKFVIINKPSNLADVVEGEVKQLAEQAKQRQIKMIYDKPASFPVLNIDEDKMRQVIMNLLDNALYYTPAGGTVTAKLEATPESVSYTVTDTGVGVPKSLQHHLFSKFYRADNARKMRPDGTGLGLYMAKKVVTAQGGAIIFQSEEGKGSTFGFTLPKARLEVKS